MLSREYRARYLSVMSKRWIEAFRVGGKASRGITPEHLAEVVADDFDANPRALCFGHPKSDDPAAGTITGAKLDGNSLMVEVASLTSKAIEGIKSGEWLNRSAAFFDPHHEANPRPGKWTLRHVGLLGGAAPGIPNMTPLKQSLAYTAEGDDPEHLEITGDPADAVVYSGAPTPVHTIFTAKEPIAMERTPEQIAADDAAAKVLKDREDKFAARVRSQFEASNGAAIDALVLAGKVLPAEADNLKTSFNALDPEAEELTFGAGDKMTKATAVSHILSFMAGLPSRVPLDGRQSPTTEFTAGEHKTAAEFNAAAEKLAKDEGITIDAATAKLAGE
jgi:hypothetical protein